MTFKLTYPSSPLGPSKMIIPNFDTSYFQFLKDDEFEKKTTMCRNSKSPGKPGGPNAKNTQSCYI